MPRRQLAAGFVAGACSVGLVWGIVATTGGHERRGGGSAHATLVAAGAPQTVGRTSRELAVFRSPRRPDDALPRALVREAAGVAVAGLRPGRSRLLVRAPSSLYAWPTASGGACIGIVHRAVRCGARLPARRPVGPTLATAAGGGRALVAGLASNSVVSVRVQALGRMCAARVVRNGFLCTLAGPGDVAGARLFVLLEDGSTQRVALG